jgi:hypothetical protein
MKITSTVQLQKYSNVVNEFTFSKVHPFESVSITKYLNKYFTDALLDIIFGYDGEATGSIKLKAYEALMQAHVSFTMLEYSSEGELTISDLGFIRSENENAKTAYAQQMKKYVEAQEENGYLFIGKLIELILSEPASFTGYLTSPVFVNNAKLFIKSALEFNMIQRLYRMHTTFYEISPAIVEVQDLQIIPAIGATLFTELLANANGMHADKVIARGYIITAIVNLTMAVALKKNLVKLTPNGVMVIGHDYQTSKQIESSPIPEYTATTYTSFNDTGIRYLERAKKQLISAGFITETTTEAKRFIA